MEDQHKQSSSNTSRKRTNTSEAVDGLMQLQTPATSTAGPSAAAADTQMDNTKRMKISDDVLLDDLGKKIAALQNDIAEVERLKSFQARTAAEIQVLQKRLRDADKILEKGEAVQKAQECKIAKKKAELDILCEKYNKSYRALSRG